MFISTLFSREKHQQTPRDIYFNSLEEAYGNLPVPSDDYADIENLLKDLYEKQGIRDFVTKAEYEREKLEEAIETIQRHYTDIAEALGKHPKFG